MCPSPVEVWIVRFDYTSKRLGGMRFGESVLTTVKRVGGLKKLEIRFDNRKACRRSVEVRIVRLDYRKVC